MSKNCPDNVQTHNVDNVQTHNVDKKMGRRKGGCAHASTYGVEVTPEVVCGLVRRLGLDICCCPRCYHLGVVGQTQSAS